jgi:GNAT superfamily N-acetyltransferase
VSPSTAAATRTHALLGRLAVVVVAVEDPRLQPLFDELFLEYTARYPEHNVGEEFRRFPDGEFEAPNGGFVVITRGAETVAGGAFRRHDPSTAEMKRIWVSAAHRRRGLGHLVMAELELLARAYGYEHAYLTTGPRQPEARSLYLAAGYTALFDTDADPETIGPLPFTKRLATDDNPVAPHGRSVDA